MYKIEFSYDRDEYTQAPIITNCWVLKDEVRIGKEGQAVCHDLDNPCKEVGRKLALTRAIHDLPVKERKVIWNLYFKR